MSRTKKQRQRLHKHNPHCHWCGRLTILIERTSNINMKLRPHQPDEATIDHLRSRFDPARRTNIQPTERRHVLSCYECNIKRGREEEIKMGDKLHERTGGIPLRSLPLNKLEEKLIKLSGSKSTKVQKQIPIILEEINRRTNSSEVGLLAQALEESKH